MYSPRKETYLEIIYENKIKCQSWSTYDKVFFCTARAATRDVSFNTKAKKSFFWVLEFLYSAHTQFINFQFQQGVCVF